MKYVICFYWHGERWNNKNNAINDTSFKKHFDRVGLVDDNLASRYVNNLFMGVSKFSSVPFKFICFTNEVLDLNEKIEVRGFILPSNKGVLPRIFMFSKEAGLHGHQVLALDIDVIIVGSLDKFLNYDGLFCTRSKFKPGQEHKIDGDIMSFKAGVENETRFWRSFVDDKGRAEEITKGRERYWVRHVTDNKVDRWDDIAPGKVLSYKRHVRRNPRAINNASIVSFHGHPRPHQVNDPWIKEYWR